jgi:hypothetical protein
MKLAAPPISHYNQHRNDSQINIVKLLRSHARSTPWAKPSLGSLFKHLPFHYTNEEHVSLGSTLTEVEHLISYQKAKRGIDDGNNFVLLPNRLESISEILIAEDTCYRKDTDGCFSSDDLKSYNNQLCLGVNSNFNKFHIEHLGAHEHKML